MDTFVPVHTPISLLPNQRTFIRQSTRSLLNEQKLINERVDWSIFKSLTNYIVYCSTHESVAVSTHAAFVIWRTSWESADLSQILCIQTFLLADLSSILCSETSLANLPLREILCSETSFASYFRRSFVDTKYDAAKLCSLQRSLCHVYTVAQWNQSIIRKFTTIENKL